METRRIRRLERRRMRRIGAMVTSIAVIGVAVGMALPQSTTASAALVGAAAVCLVIVAVRGDSVAPLHGLHRIVRLPLATSVTATMASLRSRIVGSARALARIRPRPTPLVLDEPDDDADSWWGVRPVPTAPAVDVPDVEPSAAQLPAPVLAAPMRSARVPDDDPGRIRRRLERFGAGARRPLDALGRRWKRTAGDASARTSP